MSLARPALPVVRAQPERAPRELSWSLGTLAGRLVELSASRGGALLSIALRLALDAQVQGEPVAWIARRAEPFFPPDAASMGVDLRALPVIWAADPLGGATAADLLLRSGGFGLVLVDLGPRAVLPIGVQARLVGLAKQHRAALVCLTEKERQAPSLGSLVSLRAHLPASVREDDRLRVELAVVKDKRGGPGWGHAEVCRGPDGLC